MIDFNESGMVEMLHRMIGAKPVLLRPTVVVPPKDVALILFSDLDLVENIDFIVEGERLKLVSPKAHAVRLAVNEICNA